MLLHHICELVFGCERSSLSYSISFHVLCLPLLILSSILHIVDIVIDVSASASAAFYSNFKHLECEKETSERCSSIFIGKAEYLFFFFAWIFLFTHSLVLYSAFGISDASVYTQTKEEGKKIAKKTTLTYTQRKRLHCNENQPHWTGNNNNNF